MTTGFSRIRRAKCPLGGLTRRFADDEHGATSIEYGLIVALIFLAIVAAVKGYTNSASEMYSDIASAMTQ